MQSALPCESKKADVSRLVIAGVGVVAAGLFAINAPVPAGPQIQHRAVKLAAGEQDWTAVVAGAQENLAALQSDAATANSDLTTALGSLSSEFNGQISTALTGFETGIQNSLDGGWYGGDDGYVFGLFGGDVTNPATGITESGSTLQEIATALQDGNTFQAFSYFDAWSLETLDHTLKPLLAPLLDETSKGVTTLSIPVELSQIQTNLLEAFGNYDELKAVADSALSPELSGFFALTGAVDNIAAEFAAGDTTQGLSDLNNLSSDVIGAVFNGYDAGTNPYNGAEELFTGLLNDGSLLQSLLVTWPEQFVAALGESTTTAAAESVSTALPDLFGGLF
ncbi:MAG TPA: hypothetical protein VGG53_18845 [Mycobacterium sp.]|uniref:hypothetical protein n=1 Tax=Mycobacterium sp. TaxID=1785 RepID=UPI002F41AEC3